MKIELFIVPNCPGVEGAREVLRKALAGTGESFTEIVVENDDQADQLWFLGSPSVHINDVDIEDARVTDLPAFACRTYRHGEHMLCRIPESMLQDALERARQAEAGE